MLERKMIDTIESLRWESVGEGRCRCIGCRQHGEIFDELKKSLQEKDLMPDEYFLCGIKEIENPENVRSVIYRCYVNFGNSEGIYLDIAADLRYADGTRKELDFATGKTLSEDAPAFRHMGEIAAECSLLLNGEGYKVSDGYVTNKVYANPYAEKPMTAKELIFALGFDSSKFFGKISENDMLERISGRHCDCSENEGEFILLPLNDKVVIDGEKRYMSCRKCGGYSHL